MSQYTIRIHSTRPLMSLQDAEAVQEHLTEATPVGATLHLRGWEGSTALLHSWDPTTLEFILNLSNTAVAVAAIRGAVAWILQWQQGRNEPVILETQGTSVRIPSRLDNEALQRIQTTIIALVNHSTGVRSGIPGLTRAYPAEDFEIQYDSTSVAALVERVTGYETRNIQETTSGRFRLLSTCGRTIIFEFAHPSWFVSVYDSAKARTDVYSNRSEQHAQVVTTSIFDHLSKSPGNIATVELLYWHYSRHPERPLYVYYFRTSDGPIVARRDGSAVEVERR